MKHVGLNVAADPLFTAAYTGVDGALVIVSADDRGRNADVRVNLLSGESALVVAPGAAIGPIRVTRIAAHFLSGPTADEMVLRNLKALGYAQ